MVSPWPPLPSTPGCNQGGGTATPPCQHLCLGGVQEDPPAPDTRAASAGPSLGLCCGCLPSRCGVQADGALHRPCGYCLVARGPCCGPLHLVCRQGPEEGHRRDRGHGEPGGTGCMFDTREEKEEKNLRPMCISPPPLGGHSDQMWGAGMRVWLGRPRDRGQRRGSLGRPPLWSQVGQAAPLANSPFSHPRTRAHLQLWGSRWVRRLEGVGRRRATAPRGAGWESPCCQRGAGRPQFPQPGCGRRNGGRKGGWRRRRRRWRVLVVVQERVDGGGRCRRRRKRTEKGRDARRSQSEWRRPPLRHMRLHLPLARSPRFCLPVRLPSTLRLTLRRVSSVSSSWKSSLTL